MHFNHRAYDELSRDFERIWRFLLDDYSYRQDRFIWMMSRFGDWKYGLWGENKFFPPFFRENAHLWFSDVQELLGFAISESGDETFFIFTRQGYSLNWALYEKNNGSCTRQRNPVWLNRGAQTAARPCGHASH